MICPTCRGTRTIKCFRVDETKLGRWLPIVLVPCSDCIGGVASCCDAAGENYGQAERLESDPEE
jgi:hypothetical protein